MYLYVVTFVYKVILRSGYTFRFFVSSCHIIQVNRNSRKRKNSQFPFKKKKPIMIFFSIDKKKKEGLCTKSLSFVGQSINQSLGDSSNSSSRKRGTVRPIYSTCKYLRGKKTTETFRIPPIISVLSLSVCLSFCLFRREWKPVHLLLGKRERERNYTRFLPEKKTTNKVFPSNSLACSAVLIIRGGKKQQKSNH